MQCVVPSTTLQRTAKSKGTGRSVPKSAVLGSMPHVLGYIILTLRQDSKASLLGPSPASSVNGICPKINFIHRGHHMLHNSSTKSLFFVSRILTCRDITDHFFTML